MNFIAFDLETTGTVAGVDKIVEIGAVRFINNEPEGVFSTLVDPKRPIPAGASNVNGIFDHMVEGKPLIDTLLEPFAEFCGDLPLVAHNAPFDSQFLLAEIKRHESPAPKGLILDTLPIARKVIPGLPNYKLGTLTQHLKIPSGQFHRAEEDANYCGQLFIHLIQRIKVNQVEPSLSQLVALTGKPESYFPIFERSFKQLSFID